MKELEEEIEKLPQEKVKPTRLLRSQQAAPPTTAASGEAEEEEEQDDGKKTNILFMILVWLQNLVPWPVY